MPIRVMKIGNILSSLPKCSMVELCDVKMCVNEQIALRHFCRYIIILTGDSSMYNNNFLLNRRKSDTSFRSVSNSLSIRIIRSHFLHIIHERSGRIRVYRKSYATTKTTLIEIIIKKNIPQSTLYA